MDLIFQKPLATLVAFTLLFGDAVQVHIMNGDRTEVRMKGHVWHGEKTEWALRGKADQLPTVLVGTRCYSSTV